MRIFQVGVIFGGNFPGKNCPGGSYPGWELSSGNFLWWEFSKWELSGGNRPGGNFPGESFHVTEACALNSLHVITQKMMSSRKSDEDVMIKLCKF